MIRPALLALAFAGLASAAAAGCPGAGYYDACPYAQARQGPPPAHDGRGDVGRMDEAQIAAACPVGPGERLLDCRYIPFVRRERSSFDDGATYRVWHDDRERFEPGDRREARDWDDDGAPVRRQQGGCDCDER